MTSLGFCRWLIVTEAQEGKLCRFTLMVVLVYVVSVVAGTACVVI